MSYQSSTEALCVQARRALQRAASMADHDLATRDRSEGDAGADAEKVFGELVLIFELTTAMAAGICAGQGAELVRGPASPDQPDRPDRVAAESVEWLGAPAAVLLAQLASGRASTRRR